MEYWTILIDLTEHWALKIGTGISTNQHGGLMVMDDFTDGEQFLGVFMITLW
jgi:hypothetical protein